MPRFQTSPPPPDPAPDFSLPFVRRDTSDLPDPSVMTDPTSRNPGRQRRVIRAQDRVLIERYLAFRQAPQALEVRMRLPIFRDEPIVRDQRGWRPWHSPDTVKRERDALERFAKWSPEPLLEFGLQGQPRRTGPFDLDILRAGIFAYAAYERECLTARLDPAKHGALMQKYGDTLVYRSYYWWEITRSGQAFFRFLEQEGYRPPGANPFQGVRQYQLLPHFSGKKLIVEDWYRRLMNYPLYKSRDAAMMLLLTNGLRMIELTRLRLEDLSLADQTLVVRGKGDQIRIVHLYPRTMRAVKFFLLRRTKQPGPWLFGGTRPSRTARLQGAFKQALRKVFTGPDADIAPRISPHSCRHYFVSEALRSGMKQHVLTKQAGWAHPEMARLYTHVEYQWMHEHVAEVWERIAARETRIVAAKATGQPLETVHEGGDANGRPHEDTHDDVFGRAYGRARRLPSGD